MKRPGKPEGPHYLSHQTLDGDYGIITGVTVTPGDVHNSVPYLDHLEYIHENVIPIQAAAADSAYDFLLAHRVLEEHGIDFSFGRSLPMTAHRWSSSGMLSTMTMRKTSMFAPMGNLCEKNGCTEAAAGCSGNIGRLVRIAENVCCGRNA